MSGNTFNIKEKEAEESKVVFNETASQTINETYEEKTHACERINDDRLVSYNYINSKFKKKVVLFESVVFILVVIFKTKY